MSLLASKSLGGTEEVTECWLYRPKITEPAYRSVLQRPEHEKRHKVANSVNTQHFYVMNRARIFMTLYFLFY
jgi:hypothetical protein